MSNPNKGKWYKFNDTAVESFDMTDATIEAECFGGRYEVKVYDQSKLTLLNILQLIIIF